MHFVSKTNIFVELNQILIPAFMYTTRQLGLKKTGNLEKKNLKFYMLSLTVCILFII